MNCVSDENDDEMASFFLCSVFYCVVYCVCFVYCLNLSTFMFIISLHEVTIFVTQLHNHNCFQFY